MACSFGDALNVGCGSHGTEDVATEDLVGTWSGTNIDVDNNVRPVSRLQYLYGEVEDCDLRVLDRR